MNNLELILIVLGLAVGMGAYVAVRKQWNWPTRNNPLFFAVVFVPPILLSFTPVQATTLFNVVCAVAGGMFFADTLYHRHVEKQTLKKENSRLKKLRQKPSPKQKRP